MCCFSGHVHEVSSTQIFAGHRGGGRQLLVYGMRVALDEEVAMVLPVPVPPRPADDAVSFIDLSGYDRFFDDLDDLFPKVPSGAVPLLGLAPAAFGPPQTLKVHEVGDFEASFVPSLADFSRLDRRFRLADEVWAALPGYADWGFCVFKLRPRRGGAGARIHPMAFELPRRDQDDLFFPTRHVHDGRVHAEADFDHTLYCQPEPGWHALLGWERSPESARRMPALADLVLDREAPVWRRVVVGPYPNVDIVLSGRTLRGRTAFGHGFRLRMNAAWEDVPDAEDASVRRWNLVTEPQRVALKDALLAELGPLAQARAGAWSLVAYDDALPEVSPAVHDLPGARPPELPRGCRVRFSAGNADVEPQELMIAFAGLPSAAVRAEVQSAFQAALDRAARRVVA